MNGSPKRPRTADPSTPEIDLAQLKRLASFMAEHDLEEVEYAHAGLHIRLRKTMASSNAAPDVSVSFPSNPRVDAPAGTNRSTQAAPKSSGPARTEGRHLIKSPIVGTFYAGPSPDAGPFVRAGDVIKAGQTVCIIEAMKLMNEVEADAAGEVIQVLVENGQPVEYGMPLFALRPTETKK